MRARTEWLCVAATAVAALSWRPASAWCSPGDKGDCFISIRAGDTAEAAAGSSRGIQFVHRRPGVAQEEAFGHIAGVPNAREIQFALDGAVRARLSSTGVLSVTKLHAGSPVVEELTPGEALRVSGEAHVRASPGASAATVALHGPGSGAAWALSGDAASLSLGEPGVKSLSLSRGAPPDALVVAADGSVGVGTRWPSARLDVNGGVQGTSAYSSASDRRWKTNIVPLAGALALARALRPVRFDWRHSEFPDKAFERAPQLGLIAQEVEAVLPEVISTNAQGYKSVRYGAIVPVLAGALHELEVRLAAAETAVAERDAALAEQARAVDALRDTAATLADRLGRLERRSSGLRSDVTLA
jgi:uncharacterized coiled-coil protein SlyX